MRKKGDPVKLIEYRDDGSTCEIGTWGIPSELIDNFNAQQDIGWHVMIALQRGAVKVEVVVGEVNSKS